MFFLALFLAANVSAFAYPNFLEDYKADKFTNPKNKDAVCNFCHMSPGGGDERNEFGKTFETGGEKFTPLLRAQFPDRFSYPMLKVSDTLTIHFSDPDNKVVVVQSGDTHAEVNLEKKTVDGKPATPSGGGDIVMTPPAQPAARAPGGAVNNFGQGDSRTRIPTDPLSREGAFFGQNIINLPNGKGLPGGGVDFWIGHRFPQKVFAEDSPANLFGFDSAATVAFGVRAGITDRLSVSMSRSNFFRTIEFSSNLQVSRQADGMPFSLAVRGSVEGRNNFVRHEETIPWVGYGPSLQLIAVRTFGERVSFAAVPTFAFNTRNENSTLPSFESEHDNTIAMGVGLGIRVMPTVSLVGEWVPRLWGFRGERTDRPQIGFGVQKATYRHTFSLTFSTMRPMTVSRYAQGTGGGAFSGAVDTFGIGFNVYRRLR
jgi:hypothetical protein